VHCPSIGRPVPVAAGVALLYRQSTMNTIPSRRQGVRIDVLLEKTMIYEMRTYQVQPGKAGEFLKLYQEQGLHIISRYARLIGCWTKESGVLNSVVFVWAYGQDAQWGAFVPSMLPYLVHQESVFLSPTAFSPLK
jgi:hypothetical protein